MFQSSPARERQERHDSSETSSSSSSPEVIQSSESFHGATGDFDWHRVRKCTLWKCPLCRHMRKRGPVEERECSICTQQVPKTSLMRCSHCRNISCVLCRLRVISAKNPASLNHAVARVCCCFCRHPYDRQDLIYLDLAYSNHQAQIGFKLWDFERAPAPAMSGRRRSLAFNSGLLRTAPPSMASFANEASRMRAAVFRPLLRRQEPIGHSLGSPNVFACPIRFAPTASRPINNVQVHPNYVSVMHVVGGTSSSPSLYEQRISNSTFHAIEPVQSQRPPNDEETQDSEIEAVQSLYLFDLNYNLPDQY